MIKSADGSKSTPKAKAQEVLADGISTTLGYWEEAYVDHEMTDREIKLVKAQMQKLADRMAQMLGYEESWHS